MKNMLVKLLGICIALFFFVVGVGIGLAVFEQSTNGICKIIGILIGFGSVVCIMYSCNALVFRKSWQNVNKLEIELPKKMCSYNTLIVAELQQRGINFEVKDFELPSKNGELRSYALRLAQKYIPIEDYYNIEFTELERLLIVNYNISNAHTVRFEQIMFNHRNSNGTRNIEYYENMKLRKIKPSAK